MPNTWNVSVKSPNVSSTGFNVSGLLFGNAPSAPISPCGEIDAYDLLDGSIMLSWPPFGGGTPDSFNIYANGVLQMNVTSGFAFGQGAFGVEAFGATLPGIVGGLTQCSYNPAAIAPSSGNSLRPQNMPPNGVVTPSGTYTFKVVAVSGGVEVAASADKVVTVSPTSIMLTTPMKRLWPFPNTGLD